MRRSGIIQDRHWSGICPSPSPKVGIPRKEKECLFCILGYSKQIIFSLKKSFLWLGWIDKILLYHGVGAGWESSICERKLHCPGNGTQDLLLPREIVNTGVIWNCNGELKTIYSNEIVTCTFFPELRYTIGVLLLTTPAPHPPDRHHLGSGCSWVLRFPWPRRFSLLC